MRGSRKELDLQHSPPFSIPKKLYTMVFPVLNDSRTHKSAQSVGLNPKPGITRWRVRSGPSLEKTSGELLPEEYRNVQSRITPHILPKFDRLMKGVC